MNFREIKEANKLIDEIKKLDSEVILKKEHRTKVIQVLFGIRHELAEELEKLGVVEYED